jgi:hypothetical protein
MSSRVPAGVVEIRCLRCGCGCLRERLRLRQLGPVGSCEVINTPSFPEGFFRSDIHFLKFSIHGRIDSAPRRVQTFW